MNRIGERVVGKVVGLGRGRGEMWISQGKGVGFVSMPNPKYLS